MQRLLLIIAVAVLTMSTVARADWKEGDPYKMHFPQLPDPQGWDVDITNNWVGDDWQCSQTGPVSDIHFWISFKGDYYGPDVKTAISYFWVRIYTDVPADPTNNEPYSHPGAMIYDQQVTQFQIAGPMSGNQGWLTPATNPLPSDHQLYWQVNIDPLPQPITQRQGEIYWLVLHAVPNNPPTGEIPWVGWKTSLQHFNDDAVYDIPGTQNWAELYDPFITPPQSLDQSFVITPEPTSIALLAVCCLPLLRRRHP